MPAHRTPDICRLCGVALTEETWSPSERRSHNKRCRTCCAAKCREYYHRDPKYWTGRVIQNHQALRAQMIAAYGAKCACCGESEPDFLTLDHIKNDGAAHRKTIGGGQRILYWLRDRQWPKEGFQLLCWNCNAAKQYRKVCPHELRLRVIK